MSNKDLKKDKLQQQIAKMKAKYPAEFKIETLEPALTSDIMGIVEFIVDDYTDWLLKNAYCDADVYAEEPKATDEYLKQFGIL